MSIKKWGKHGWYFFYNVANSYPDNPTEQDKKEMYSFFIYTSKVLPCVSCRINMAKHMEIYKLDNNVLQSRDNLIEWLVNIENSVLASQSRQLITKQQAIDKYIIQENDNTNIYILVLLLIVLLGIVFVKNKHFK